MSFEELKKEIKKREGYRSTCYFDTLGNPTIGYGHLLPSYDSTIKINEAIAGLIFEVDFFAAEKGAEEILKLYKSIEINSVYHEVIIEMVYVLGYAGTLKFKNFLSACNVADKYKAIRELEDSLWYRQVQRRVKVLIDKIQSIRS